MRSACLGEGSFEREETVESGWRIVRNENQRGCETGSPSNEGTGKDDTPDVS